MWRARTAAASNACSCSSLVHDGIEMHGTAHDARRLVPLPAVTDGPHPRRPRESHPDAKGATTPSRHPPNSRTPSASEAWPPPVGHERPRRPGGGGRARRLCYKHQQARLARRRRMAGVDEPRMRVLHRRRRPLPVAARRVRRGGFASRTSRCAQDESREFLEPDSACSGRCARNPGLSSGASV